MGAEPASILGSPESERLAQECRSARLTTIGDMVRMYRELDQALSKVGDAELAKMSALARGGQRGMEQWARRIDAFRGFKWRFEAGQLPVEPCRADEVGRSTVAPVRRRYLLWEAAAFLLGFIIALLLT